MAYSPTPGHEKIVSVMMAPPIRRPTCSPMTVITGSIAFRRACLKTTRQGTTPLALAVRT